MGDNHLLPRVVPPGRWRRARLLALALLPLLLAGCQAVVLDPAGDVARQQRDIILISTALMLLIIVPVMVLTVLFAWRYRQGSGATYDPDFDHSTSLELVIWAAPLLIIICLGALTWSSTHLLDPFRPLDRIAPGRPVDRAVPPLVVQVVSLDWKWLFIYPEQGIAAVNELVLPVDRQVRFDITSSNMMNTFYAPTLAGMIYAMPGMRSQLHAVLNRQGTYAGYSGNYSGPGFSEMRFRLQGTDEAGFEAWVARARASPVNLAAADYLRLAEPSVRNPAALYAAVQDGLFGRVLERCVAPGQACMGAVMAGDAARAGGLVPPGRGSVPAPGEKPKGAIFLDGAEKGSGQNVTGPGPRDVPPGTRDPSPPGPGAPHRH